MWLPTDIHLTPFGVLVIYDGKSKMVGDLPPVTPPKRKHR